MYNIDNVKSSLCSGIQWDMVMKFVDGKKDGKNKVFNVRILDETRHVGKICLSGSNEK